jgi:hypothetical protein
MPSDATSPSSPASTSRASERGDEQRPTSTEARVRVVHQYPIPSASSVEVLGDQGTSLSAQVAFGARVESLSLAPGRRTITVRTTTEPRRELISITTPALDAGKDYLLVLYRDAGRGRPLLAASISEDTAPSSASDDHAMLSFFNGIFGTTMIDVCVAGATAAEPSTPVFRWVSYGAWGNATGEGAIGRHAKIAVASLARLRLYAASERAPCTGRAIGDLALASSSLRVMTAIATNAPTSTRGSRVLLCPSVGHEGECSTIDVRR